MASNNAPLPIKPSTHRVPILRAQSPALLAALLLVALALGGCIKKEMFKDVRLRNALPELVLPIASDTIWPSRILKPGLYGYDEQGTLCAINKIELSLPVALFTNNHIAPSLEGISISCSTPDNKQGFYGLLPISQALQSITFSRLSLQVSPLRSGASTISLGGQTVAVGQSTLDTITFQCSTVVENGIKNVKLYASEPCTVSFSKYAEALFAIEKTTALPQRLFSISELKLPIDFFDDKLYANFLLDHGELRCVVRRQGLLRRIGLRVAFFNVNTHTRQVPNDFDGSQEPYLLLSTPLSSNPNVNDPLKIGFNTNSTAPSKLCYSIIPPTHDDSIVLSANTHNSNFAQAIQHGPNSISFGSIRFYSLAPQGPNNVVLCYTRGSATNGLPDMVDVSLCARIPVQGQINSILYANNLNVSLTPDLSNENYQPTPKDKITIFLQFINSTPLNAHLYAALLKTDNSSSALSPLNFGQDQSLHELCPYFSNLCPQILTQAALAANNDSEETNNSSRHTLSLSMSYEEYQKLAKETAKIQLLYHFSSPNGQKVRIKKGDKLIVRLGLGVQLDTQKVKP